MFRSRKQKKVKEGRVICGIDIGTSAVRMVRLHLLADSAELVDFAVNPAIKDIVAKLDVKRVNTALSGPSALIRYVQFPRMQKLELKQALRFEAQKHIPFSVADLNLDAYTLKPELPDNKMLVLLVAIKKEIVNDRLKILRDAGLEAGIIDFDAIALVNAFTYSYAQEESVKDKTVALLNIGASFSNLNILESSVPRMSRDIHAAGNNLTRKIMDVFSIDFKAAEQLKRQPDDEKASRINTLAEAVLSDIASQVRTSFDYYESQSTSSVSRIFLSGGASIGTGVREMLESSLGMEVVTWDPLKKITISPNLEAAKVQEAAHELGVAVGLALRG